MADQMLAQAFGAMKIELKDSNHPTQHAKHHTVTFSYPDFSIPIQPTEAPELLPPAKMEHRQHPPHNMTELALYDTEFAVAFPIEKVHTGAHQNEYMRLLLAVEKLKGCAGKSTLGVIRVSQEIWESVAYRVRLETEWVGPFQKHPPQDFELSEEEWARFKSYSGLRAWVGVLGHLVDRTSAKAYYHARQRIMAACGSDDEVAKEETSFASKWGIKRALNAADLFLERITFLKENCQNQVMPEIQLECGHGFWLDAMKTSAINSLTVLTRSCEVCGVKLLTEQDKEYLDAVAEQNDVAKFAKMQKVWANLVGSGTEVGKPRKFHSMTIFRVLGAALESLKAPEWVAPTAICPSNFVETREVLDHLESMFYDQHRTYERTAEHLLEELEQEAMGVRIDDVMIGERVNPPGFDDFLARWLRRTAYFLAYRRCDGEPNNRCQGLHWHRNGLWYAPKEWERAEGERFEENDDAPFQMKSVMKALEGIEL